ncbi:alcohol dehydrogenase catalytic domain-containing protein [Acidianus manzaensis]|uniref:Alcohol dehydrogenase n=1 Tax=Acidianus manzaensis TaxID=282676 RepID=A0A1W6K3G0_9CREN|nr:alcohol dehydrogenase catalytic domain-containing protein [Acidianus manzaensis]ARM77081.1 alcohol dehydrogenase [Acidianus manzaensis]
MKAAVVEEFGKPLVIKQIEKIDKNEKDIDIKIKASGICGRDIVIWKGGFKNLHPPLILGHEIFGEYNGRPVGVYGTIICKKCKYCNSERENLCENSIFLGEGRPGGYADEVYVPADNIYYLPDDNYKAYAASVCPLATAIHASRLANIKRGDKVLVTGAGGGVGIHLLQYLRLLGVQLVSITSESKKEIVSKYSDITITQRDFSKLIKDVDVVMELVGNQTINESLRALSRDGTLILIGNIEGSEISLKRPALTIMRQQRIIGSAAYTRQEVLEAVKLIHDQKIIPFYETFSLEDVNIAIEKLNNSKIIGRAVLIP